jgi:hypothetical protein
MSLRSALFNIAPVELAVPRKPGNASYVFDFLDGAEGTTLILKSQWVSSPKPPKI